MAPVRHSTLAAFYSRHLALHEGSILEWTDLEPARRIALNAVHVAVARNESYAIDRSGRLLQWSIDSPQPRVFAEHIAHASAGESAVLAVTTDGLLIKRAPGASVWTEVASDVVQGWVGDSSDYYIARDGRLHVSGLAHRGQYGDGLLTAVDGWKHVANDVVHVCAHTGHAVLLKSGGTAEGTGGNRFGPLGHHGFGDKADRWGTIFEDATHIATGARNTLAIRSDGTLWVWGEHVGLDPVHVMDDVSDVACGDHHAIARTRDERLWFWALGAPPTRLLSM